MTGDKTVIRIVGLGRPPTANKHLRSHPLATAAATKKWKYHAGGLWRGVLEEGGRALKFPVVVVATPLHADRRSPQDAGACLPAVKAVVDGLVGVGGLPDDGPAYVSEIRFKAPVVCGEDGLLMEVYEGG